MRNGPSRTSSLSWALSPLVLDHVKINDKPGEENGSMQKARKVRLAFPSGKPLSSCPDKYGEREPEKEAQTTDQKPQVAGPGAARRPERRGPRPAACLAPWE